MMWNDLQEERQFCVSVKLLDFFSLLACLYRILDSYFKDIP